MIRLSKLKTTTALLALAAVSCLTANTSADFIYAQSISDSSGSFGTGGGVVGAGNPELTLGPPDGQFIQFGFASSLTLDLATISSGSTLLALFTADDLFPATARVEVSADNSLYTLVANSVSDANGVALGSFHPFAPVPIDIPFRYVRITDLGTSPAPFQSLGFDLDAVGVEAAATPEPSSIMLFAIASIGVLGLARRRRTDAAG